MGPGGRGCGLDICARPAATVSEKRTVKNGSRPRQFLLLIRGMTVVEFKFKIVYLERYIFVYSFSALTVNA
jgi:hypothetical protein